MSILSPAGAKVYLDEAGYFHPKTLNLDNAVITIGTANMEPGSVQELRAGASLWGFGLPAGFAATLIMGKEADKTR